MLGSVYVYVVPWSGFSIIPSFPHTCSAMVGVPRRPFLHSYVQCHGLSLPSSPPTLIYAVPWPEFHILPSSLHYPQARHAAAGKEGTLSGEKILESCCFAQKSPCRGHRTLPFVYEIPRCVLPPRIEKAPRPEPCSTSFSRRLIHKLTLE